MAEFEPSRAQVNIAGAVILVAVLTLVGLVAYLGITLIGLIG